MSLPQFTATSKITDSETTSTQQVVRSFNSLVSNLTGIFNSLLKRVQLDSTVLQGVTLTIGDNVIPHTLGRTLTGWTVVSNNTAISLFDKQTTTTYNTATYLVLNSSTTATVSLLVF